MSSKSVRILDIIASRDGMRYTDIVRELCLMAGLDPEERVIRQMWDYHRHMTRPMSVRRHRGYWSTNLTSAGRPPPKCRHGIGLLGFFCAKGSDGLWRRNCVPHYGRPWHLLRAMGGHNLRAALLGYEVPDWRPIESLPEDHYAI